MRRNLLLASAALALSPWAIQAAPRHQAANSSANSGTTSRTKPSTTPPALKTPPPPQAPSSAALPETVLAALQRLKVPASALGVLVLPLEPGASATLSWNAQQAFNPASLFKLVTTYAALDLLGPAFVWRTPAYLQGKLENGVLAGNLILRGSGDPTLVQERLWLLLRRLRQLGLREIQGDILLDRSLFAPPEGQPGDFDGDPSRPYNVQPDSLLLNFKTLSLSFQPDANRKQARVMVEPALAGLEWPASVPMASDSANPSRSGNNSSNCEELRSQLQIRNEPATRLQLGGSLPAGCESQTVQLAYADAPSYGPRLIAALWRELGGELRGQVKDGALPPGLAVVAESVSAPLAQVVRDINKFSNNVMAEQLLLTLAAHSRLQPQVQSLNQAIAPPANLPANSPVSLADGRATLQRWASERFGAASLEGLVFDNGSGLSRRSRLTPLWLAQLLQHAFHSPVMAELLASLPITGVDGTLRRSQASPGRAHLKTGTLRDASGIAGYVLDAQGRQQVLVAMLSHEQAPAARPVFDALVEWTIRNPLDPHR
jgi:D-alanyl-D-alanine carboxypeptidase/D-alanyl-D-alanine-endopeptidase (penicillin-binding protein 4)